MIGADDGIIDGHGNVFAAVVTVLIGNKNVEVGGGRLSSLGVDNVASEDEDLIVERYRRCCQSPRHAGHGTFFGPYAGIGIEFVGGVGDCVPGFLWTDAHEGENFGSALVMGNRN